MHTLTFLNQRQSEKNLTYPIPDEAQLNQIFEAAVHVPDHGRLQPYRFVVITPEVMPKFQDLLQKGVDELNLGENRRQKAQIICQNSPMFIAVIASLTPNFEKVPIWEQQACASCSVYALQLAACALGFDNAWLTGKWLASEAVRNGLNCTENEQIIALVAIGSCAEKSPVKPKKKSIQSLVSYLTF